MSLAERIGTMNTPLRDSVLDCGCPSAALALGAKALRKPQIRPPHRGCRKKSARRTGAVQNLAEVRTVHDKDRGEEERREPITVVRIGVLVEMSKNQKWPPGTDAERVTSQPGRTVDPLVRLWSIPDTRAVI